MNKRKLDDYLVKSHDKIVEKINHPQVSYHNPANNDTIYIIDNRIVFHSTVTNETIQKLFEYVKMIITSSNFNNYDNRVYIHIVSLGGLISSLIEFISIKNNYYSNYEFVSVIENNCTDAGFLLASLCDFRIIKKKSFCNMSPIIIQNKYWGIFLQDDNIATNLEFIIQNSKCKVTREKISKYFSQNNCWNSRKMLKIGFVDEIV